MPQTLTFGFTVGDGTADSLFGQITASADAVLKEQVDISSVRTNYPVALPYTIAQIKAIGITSPVAATVKTNNIGPDPVPDNVYTIVAGGFSGGAVGSAVEPVIDADFVTLYVTTTVVSTTPLKIWLLLDLS